MNKKQSVLKRALSLVLSAGVAMGGIPLSRSEKVYAAEPDRFTSSAYANHWGRSDLRAYMNNGLGTISGTTVSEKNYKLDSTKSSDNTSGFAANFSDAEYARIEPVTIETNVLDSSAKATSTYTTTDKIWLPSANRYKDSTLKYVTSWGTKDLSADSIYESEVENGVNLHRIIPLSYWSYGSSNYSWLRSPYCTFTHNSL